MAKAAFDKIAGGLNEAMEIARRDATITALRKRVEDLERVGRDVAARMHRQVKASDAYAEQHAKKDELRPTVWQICNSHFTDLARELEAALRAKGGDNGE